MALIFHQAACSGHRGLFLDEVGKLQLQVGTAGLQVVFHITQDRIHPVNTDLTVILVEDLDKAAHVGALEVMGQINIHVDPRHRLLLFIALVEDNNRVADILDANLVDGDVAIIAGFLHIGHPAACIGRTRKIFVVRTLCHFSLLCRL